MSQSPHSTVTVVVGNGMVSHRFCQALTERDPERRHRLVVIGEERLPAYDRVNLTSYLGLSSAAPLLLGTREWYEERGVDLRLGTRIARIDRTERLAITSEGEPLHYDTLVLATGSASFVPRLPGIDLPGVFMYRTIDDLDGIASYSARARRAVVIGGGLLGLEAARAMRDRGIETHVVEVAPRLMPRQLDEGAASLLQATIHKMGIHVHVDSRVKRIVGAGQVAGVELAPGRAGPGAPVDAHGPSLDADLVLVCAGIRPRDELAREARLDVATEGGVVVDDRLRTSDPRIFAIGEVARHAGVLYGLVAPGYEMAETVARVLVGEAAAFHGSDESARLKVLGTDVASVGSPFQDPADTTVVTLHDQVRRVYKKLVFQKDKRRLLGAILVGDASAYGSLLTLARSNAVLSEGLDEFEPPTVGSRRSLAPARGAPAPEPPICSCNGVSAQTIRDAVRRERLATVAEVKACTRAGATCGGCVPQVSDILAQELKAAGRAVKPRLCEHFTQTRRELFEIVAARGIRTFAELVAAHGSGAGCEICKPTVASILASVHAEPVLGRPHRTLQDTNDRFLANIQKDGTYSVVPRVAGGEITPDKLMAIASVAKKYALTTKLTGGQRIDLLGARLEQLPDIWAELVAAGFESGQAYGKSMRTVKSCVGSTWCRYGVQDSTAFAVRLENRYKGIRAPHKLKSAVSGCVRECAEAQSKDFGLVATEKGWNLYVCGNGGVTPRHADLLAAGIGDELAVRYIDRFLMFYIRTADRLTRTSVWLDKMEGGIEHLRDVVVHDTLGIGADLEAAMDRLVAAYRCEWADAVGDPEKRAMISGSARRVVATSPPPAPSVAPAATGEPARPAPYESARRLRVIHRQWVRVASIDEVPADGGIAVRYGSHEIALFHFAARGEWYATQNACPHSNQQVLARGILGEQGGAPKVACPLHKKTFHLETGSCLSGEPLEVATYPVRVEGADVFVELPPVHELRDPACSPNETATG